MVLISSIPRIRRVALEQGASKSGSANRESEGSFDSDDCAIALRPCAAQRETTVQRQNAEQVALAFDVPAAIRKVCVLVVIVPAD